jgi:hypothetical protein
MFNKHTGSALSIPDPDPDFIPSQILNPKTTTKREGEKRHRKRFEPIDKEFKYF